MELQKKKEQLSASFVPNKQLRYHRKMRHWTQADLADELYILSDPEKERARGVISANMIGSWERGEHMPSPFWQKKLSLLFATTPDQLGFLRDVSPVPEQTPPNIQEEDVEQDFASLSPLPAEKYATISPRPNDYPSAFSTALTGQRLDNEDMEQSRRDLLQRVFGVTGALYVQPHQELLQLETWERLARALARPSRVDAVTLEHLEKLTENCWQLLPDITQIVSGELLSTVLGHLRQITSILEGSLPEETHQRLCSLASQLAQIAGEMFSSVYDYTAAQAYYRVAFEAAREAKNSALAAVCLGRMGFLPFYSGNATASLPLLQGARRLASLEVSPTIRAWLAAVEAEAQANAQDADACFRALEGTELSYNIQDDPYRTTFDAAKFAGYHGVCHLRLHQPGKAQIRLQQGLDKLDPSAIYQRSVILTDLASTSAAMEEIEAVGLYAFEALKIIQRTKSLSVLQRMYKLQEDLKPWQAHPLVKDLEEQIHLTKTALLPNLI